jgi:heme A synthase
MLLEIHQWVGYFVSIVVLVSAILAFSRAKDAREFTKGPYVGAMVLLDIQVLLGLVLYGVEAYWDADPMIAYVHPLLAIAALGAGHALLGKAKKQRMAVEAHRTAGRGLVIAFVLVLAAIGVASAF